MIGLRRDAVMTQNFKTVTWTVLHRSKADPLARSFATGMVDAHSYDHAEQCFGDEFPKEAILGIYAGDLSHKVASEQYLAEDLDR